MPTALVADDEPAIREIFQAFLTMQGYTVLTAPDGVAALQAVTTQPPDLLLLDNQMPRMTGLEVLRTLQAEGRQFPVVLMSGHLDDAICAEAHALGARACLQKPVGLPALAQCLAALARPPRVRVLVADDHLLVRQTLAAFLQAEEDVEVVGEAGDGGQAVALAQALRPDVVLMDITMPVMDGVAATQAITATCPGVQVIGLSMHERTLQAPLMLAAGAIGYVSKTESADALLAVLRTARTWARDAAAA